MKYSNKTIFFIGNLDSNLFRIRLDEITRGLNTTNYVIINTSRKKLINVIKFIFDSFKIVFHCLFISNTKIIFHGAYNSILWLLVLINKTYVISILQGSELEKDYTKYRSFFIDLILKKSKLIVCRNQNQISFLNKNLNHEKNNKIIVHWGLNKKLFNLKKTKFYESINFISPRASQNEYNINVIFDAVKIIKDKYPHIRFTYVKFNSNIKLKNHKIADEILVRPNQYDLWNELVNSDISISIPKYDGLSNTVLESLALGNFLILSNLDSYQFIKDKNFLGAFIKIGNNYEKNVRSLYLMLEKIINDIQNIRLNSNKRRQFIKKKYLNKINFQYMLEIIKKV